MTRLNPSCCKGQHRESLCADCQELWDLHRANLGIDALVSNDASMIPPTINWAEVSAAGQSEDGPVMNRSDDGPVPVEIDWAAMAALPGR